MPKPTREQVRAFDSAMTESEYAWRQKRVKELRTKGKRRKDVVAQINIEAAEQPWTKE